MKSKVDLLRTLQLPVFSTISELASTMHLSSKLVFMYSKFSSRYYFRYAIPKTHSGYRVIHQPNRTLKALQAWVLRRILDRLPMSAQATAYIPGLSLTHNILPHQDNRYFLCLDLEDFFPSISIRRVARVFRLVGYSGRMAHVMAAICTCDGTLPQGGVTSPALSNLIAASLDRRIAGFADRRNVAYTRYADDITLSANDPMLLTTSLWQVTEIITSEHFLPNAKKTRILGPGRQCRITGLVKNEIDPKFGIGKKKKRRMRGIMYRIAAGRGSFSPYQDEASIVGWLNFLKSVDADGYSQMKAYWDRLLLRRDSQQSSE